MSRKWLTRRASAACAPLAPWPGAARTGRNVRRHVRQVLHSMVQASHDLFGHYPQVLCGMAAELKRPLIERDLVFSDAGASPSRVRRQSLERSYVEFKRFSIEADRT